MSRRLQDYFKPSCHARTVRDCGSNRTPVSVNVTLLFTLPVDAEDELRNVSSPPETDSSKLFSALLSCGKEQNGAETSRLKRNSAEFQRLAVFSGLTADVWKSSESPFCHFYFQIKEVFVSDTVYRSNTREVKIYRIHVSMCYKLDAANPMWTLCFYL